MLTATWDQEFQSELLEIILSIIQIKSSAKVVVMAVCFPGVLLKDQHIHSFLLRFFALRPHTQTRITMTKKTLVIHYASGFGFLPN